MPSSARTPFSTALLALVANKMKGLWVVLGCVSVGVMLMLATSDSVPSNIDSSVAGLSLHGLDPSLVLALEGTCHSSCLTCKGPLVTDCLSCDSKSKLAFLDPSGRCMKYCSKNFINDPSIGKMCVNTCPDRTAANPSRECVPCHSSCDTCKGSLNTQCLTCNQTSSTPYITHDNKCVDDCPFRTFKWTNNGVKECMFECVGGIYNSGEDSFCHYCHHTCAECINKEATDCTACSLSGAYPFLYRRQCLSTCPPGTYKFNNPAGYKECRDNCGNGYFFDAQTEYCVACGKTCVTCSDSAGCTSCAAATPYLSQNQCLAECPSGSFNSIDATGKKECKSTCGDGFYMFENTCNKCHSTCLTCSGPGPSACLTCDKQGENPIFRDNTCSLTCPTGTFMHENANGFRECVATCGDGFAIIPENNQCVDCPSTCATCSGSAPGQCLTCQTTSALYMNSGYCLLDCPTQLLKTEKEGVKQCVARCGDKYWVDVASRTCLPCAETCLTCKGAQAADCLTCLEGLYYFENHCLADCPAGLHKSKAGGKWTCEVNCQTGYGLDDTNTCQPCDPTCYLCSKPTECMICSPTGSTPYLLNTQCVDACPPGTYKFTNAKGYLQCIATCGDGFYVDGTMTCLPCAKSCKTCDGSGCLTCDQSGPTPFLYTHQCLSTCSSPTFNFNSDAGKTCIDVCPSTHFIDTASNYCFPCDSTCLTCSSAAKDACVSCDQSGTTPFLSNGNCLSNCGAGTYRFTNKEGNMVCVDTCGTGMHLDETSQWCHPCHSSCLECSSTEETGCISCLQAGATPFFSAGQCLAECPLGTFQYINPAGYHQCIDSCGDGFVVLGQNICEKCHFSCSTCSGPNADQCVQCDAQGQYPYAKDSLCLRSCPTGTFHVLLASGFKACVTSCKSTFYVDPNSNTCLRCDPTCGSCSGSGVDQCTSCDPSGAYPYALDGQCLSSCPADTVLEDRNGVQICHRTCKAGTAYVPAQNTCVKCHATCATCSGPLETNCLTCGSTQPLWEEGKCVTKCAAATAVKYIDATGRKSCKADCEVGFVVDTDGYCKACHSTCEQCSSTSSTSCTLCDSKGPYPLLVSGKCLATCPAGTTRFEGSNGFKTCKSSCGDGFVLNSATGYCLQCDQNCQSCDAKDQSKCLSCAYASTYPYLVGTTCAAFCPAGFYQMNDKARQEHRCVKSCGEGYYIDIMTSNCAECHSTCLTCSGPGAQDCLSCEDLTKTPFFLHGSCHAACPKGFEGKKSGSTRFCKSICESGHYFDGSSEVCMACPETCSECTSDTMCTKCADASPYMHEGSCLSECPNETFKFTDSQGKSCVEYCGVGYTAKDGECQACHASCRTCGEPHASTGCESCYPYGNYPFLAAGSCLETCDKPRVQYMVGTLLQCLTECPIGTFTYTDLHDSICVYECPEGFYSNSTTHTCEPCHSTCLTCTDAESTSCLSCATATPYIAPNNTCLAACTRPYYSLSDVDGSRCVEECPHVYYYNSGSYYCLDKCLEGYYQVGWKCITKEEGMAWGIYLLIILIILLGGAGCCYSVYRIYKKCKKHHRRGGSASSSSSDEMKEPLIRPSPD